MCDFEVGSDHADVRSLASHPLFRSFLDATLALVSRDWTSIGLRLYMSGVAQSMRKNGPRTATISDGRAGRSAHLAAIR